MPLRYPDDEALKEAVCGGS